jgi:polysaccharide export outer membrane protein
MDMKQAKYLQPVGLGRWMIVGLLFMSCLVVGACGGKTKVVDAPPPLPPVEASEYHIGPGDNLKIFVWNHPDLSVTVPVRPDGMISTPLIENMQAEGKTPSELSRDIETTLAEYIRSPTVNVIVTEFVGAYSDQVRVVGQAQQPQSLPYRANMTLLDVMIAVGGLAEFAAGDRAVIVRRDGDQQLRIPARLSDLLNDGDISANQPVRPGDVIIIPESRF